MYSVYAISSLAHNYIYIGLTKDISNRIRRHNNGWEKTTRFYSPFVLIYQEECKTRPEARAREKYWKSGSGKQKLRILRNSLK